MHVRGIVLCQCASLHRGGSLRTHDEPHGLCCSHRWSKELVLRAPYLSCDTPEPDQLWHLFVSITQSTTLWQPFAQNTCTTESSCTLHSATTAQLACVFSGCSHLLHYRRLVLCRAVIRVPWTTFLPPPSGEEVDRIGGRVGGSANKKGLNRSRTFCVERTCE